MANIVELLRTNQTCGTEQSQNVCSRNSLISINYLVSQCAFSTTP